MSDREHPDATDERTRAADRNDSARGAGADRPPTDEEAAAAEEAAGDVDVERVARHAEEMSRIGAEVEGEGRI